jgi:putative spermidine/putrescine transport system ATP-binding protein
MPRASATVGMALIEFEHVRKVYADAAPPAVDDLNLHIQAGEFLTLLGPSGSGKTTTLMLLAGFERPTSGHIRLDGKPIEALPPHKRNMGVVFQSYSLFPHMTVAQNVAFPLSVRKVVADEARTRVAAALAKVHLRDLSQRRPQQLSGGQQQRVALARALVFEPRLVLMDEPLSALDKKLREEMQLEIRRLHRELGVTMVYVTHDQHEAMTLSDRVAVFNQGRVEQLATPKLLYDAPANPFVAGFLGDNNMIDAAVESGSAGAAVQLRAADGSALRARGGPSFGQQRGAAATLCVRPEALRIAGDARTSQAENRLRATLVDAIHQGDHWRLVMQLHGAASAATQWFAKVNASALPPGLAPGQDVDLAFRAEDAWAF